MHQMGKDMGRGIGQKQVTMISSTRIIIIFFLCMFPTTRCQIVHATSCHQEAFSVCSAPSRPWSTLESKGFYILVASSFIYRGPFFPGPIPTYNRCRPFHWLGEWVVKSSVEIAWTTRNQTPSPPFGTPPAAS